MYNPGGPSMASSTNDPSLARYTDKAWAVAFLANVCITFIAAAEFGGTATPAGGHLRRLAVDSNFEGIHVARFVLAVLAWTLVTWGINSGTLTLLAKYPKWALQAAYLGPLGIFWVIAVTLFFSGFSLAALLVGVVCALCLLLFVTRQSRIRFGAANLKVAALAVKSTPTIIRFPLLMGIAHYVWIVASFIAATGTIAAAITVVGPDGTSYPAAECEDVTTGNEEGVVRTYCQCGGIEISADDGGCDYTSNMSGLLLCFWLLSFAWGSAVAQNVVAATVAGSVASWWFSPGKTKSAVGSAFRRAVLGSFGSLCKAAAVMLVVRIVLYPLRRVRCLCFSLRRVCMSFAHHGLSFVICFISIYGMSFSEALEQASELFSQCGVTMIVNDAVISVGIHLLGVCMMLIYAVAMAVTWMVLVPGGAVELLMFSWAWFLVPIPAMVYFWTMLRVVRSSQKTVCVCFIQDRDALQANHGGPIFDELAEAWDQGCPDVGVSQRPSDPLMIEFPEISSTTSAKKRNTNYSNMASVGGGAAYGMHLV